ncbi:Hsp20 family protein [Neorhizobium sp. JUb45]|uniref:Hsp20 family protein n=1 Tax=Rhizobium/Agrobacterium group TaxID=227290 RepID=UPI0010483AA1|nr:Hsp20 family protein [Neorhizobium sp. JUb45]TCQ99348.1 molecular chaperone IbpA [Neorhizobium sp. JUb45]
MRTELDFAPLYRSSIGFDRVFNLLNNTQRLNAIDTWPAYDIVKTGEDDYRITMAVAGFGDGDLDITQERNVLFVKGGKAEEPQGEYLHRGIAGRSFERKFELADHVRVEGADLRHGLLTISLKREVPEAMKPRKIEIGVASSSEPLRLETDRQVA